MKEIEAKQGYQQGARVSQRLPNESWRITHSDIDLRKKKNIRDETRHPHKRDLIVNPQWIGENAAKTSKSQQSDMIVTSINQSNELQLVRDIEVARAEGQTSTTWLQNHSLEAQSLTLRDILKEGIPVKPPKIRDEEQIGQHLKFYTSVLDEFESKLKRHLNICQDRISWLLRDSRRAFGLITAKCPCILLDVSETNTGFGRLKLIQDSLRQLVADQLRKKEKLYVSSFGSSIHPLWRTVRDVNCRIVEEMHYWIDCLHPDGGCNVMSVLRHVVKRNDIDGIVLILGNCPDQNPQLIIDYVKESLAGRSIPFHTVAYNCNISSTNMFLEELAEVSQGRYHCYSAVNEDDIMSGTDLKMLTKELQTTIQVLSQIENIRNGGKVENRFVSVADQPSLEVLQATKENAVQIYDRNVEALSVEQPSFPIRTSKDWLLQHSLKAKGLTLYQVMAPNAFDYVNSYISSINKTVSSQVHHRSMVQLKWYDGSTKNVHVDPVMLFNYQHHLDVVLQHYRRRMEWLTTGSRKIFGSIVEKRVVILVDMSLAMAGDLMRLHGDVRQLLEQQLPATELFNVICFGAKATPFQPSMIPPSPENLESTFRWMLRQTCSGSRKFMDAFRLALENEEERKRGICVDSVYLVTTGIPDEPKEVACSYIQEAFSGGETVLHCVYYEPEETDIVPVAGRYADSDTTIAYLKELSHCVRGRFHWVKGNDIMESDDLRLISDEGDKAHNYRKKAEVLLDSLKQRHSRGEATEPLQSIELVPRPPSGAKRRIGPPRQTVLSQARIDSVRPGSSKPSTSSSSGKNRVNSAAILKEEPGSLIWKPNTASSTTTLIPPISSGDESSSVNLTKSSKQQVTASQQTFYTEVGNETGFVFKSYEPPQSSSGKRKKSFTNTKAIPEHEENITTKEWLHKYSMAKLKLDLNAIVNATECSHSKSKVSSLKKAIPAKYCDIFPSIVINGVTKHLHLQAKDLEEYEEMLEKVLKRYVKRLQWLLSGSRKVFGSIIEKNVLVLVDVSGSMVTNMDDLKKEMNSIIWEQIHKNKINFSVMKFSTSPELWSGKLLEPTEDACQQSINWISEFEAYGGTCTIDAIRLAFGVENVEGIYLLSDGKPDTSTTSVLREVAILFANKKIKIHTISFNCEDSVANRFLQLLATQTGGRYHRFQGNVDTEIPTYNMLTNDLENESQIVPLLEGDDTRRLVKEIKFCRQCLKQSQYYRKLSTNHVVNSQSNRISVRNSPVTAKQMNGHLAEVS